MNEPIDPDKAEELFAYIARLKERITALEEQRATLLEALEEWERVEEKARAAIDKAEAGKEAPDA